jgi:oxalate decarboxylase/phosphoglucose isomerase-like protein (cupin superfamily)
MTHVDFNELKWVYSDKHDCYLGVSDKLPSNTFADIVFAKVLPGHTLKPHYHKRPQNGYEAFFFFKGGHIELISENGRRTTYRKAIPFYLYFVSNEIHGIRNLGNEDLFFEVICAPKFDPNEETFV